MTGDTFEASVTDMMQTLYRVTCSQLSVEADREDAVQEALRRAWEKKDSLINDSFFRTWIIRILLNVCHDIQREKQRMIPAASVPEPPPGPETPSVDLKECLLRLEERERIPILHAGSCRAFAGRMCLNHEKSGRFPEGLRAGNSGF